ncbi:MAG: DUF3035 domain-containing protein [Proteobacteria bacterium]|nr:DUF3035 domain-containing protein [Pseudomonadota bacterium]
MLKKHDKLSHGLVLIALAIALSGCTSVKKELGVGRNSPDEFTVVKRAPLTMPPDYTLRPPGSPAETAPAAEATNTVKAALLGKTEVPVTQSSSDQVLLDKMGTTMANPDIRQKIEEDNGYISLKNQSVADKLIFWDDEKQPPLDRTPTSVVNPTAEAERIKKNKAEGKPINEGNVPVIEKKTSTLEKLF